MMGMYCNLYTLSDAEAQNLLNNPETIHTFLKTQNSDSNTLVD
jgi:hypothetical protein